jgi:hypothetical protein
VRALSRFLPAFALAATGLGLSSVPAATPMPANVPAAAASYQPALPVNGTLFYPVDVPTKSRYHGTRRVDSRDVEVIRNQVLDMQYAGQQVGLYSWAGRTSFSERAFPAHLRAADDTTFRWAILDELEGLAGPNGGDPTAAQIKADLDHLYAAYGSDPSYFRVGGKPVVFAYNDAGDTCNMATRWRQANSAGHFYLVLKVVHGYTGCLQPNSWWGYDPSQRSFQAGNSYQVSPGMWRYNEASARLGRSVAGFAAGVRAMKSAKVRFRLTTTWNEWYDGTSVESAREWASGSGHGYYADQLHSILGAAVTPPAPPSVLNASTLGQGITLTWNASSGASSYQVFRNGCLVATVTGTSWVDRALTDSSASYFVKAANFRGTSRRGPVRIAAAGLPTAAPSSGGDGLVALPGQRLLSTSTGAGVGCAARQRGQAVLSMPASVPADATGVVLTVHAINPLGSGAVQVFPVGVSAPPVNEVRYYSSRSTSNTTVVPLGTARQVVVQESGAATHLWVDLIGYSAPGRNGLDMLSTSPPDRVFYNTRSSSAAAGGTATKKLQGTVTFPLPTAPAGATAAQVRVMVSSADGSGTVTVFNGSSTPPVASLAYAPSVILTSSVLVPVTAGRTVSLTVSRNASVALALEGWVQPAGRSLTVRTPTRLVATSARVTSQSITLPDAYKGHAVLLNVGIASALGYGNLTVAPSTMTPNMQTTSYGPQQPQSGFVWVYVPASGVVKVTLTSAALLYVDLLADA